MSTPSIIAIARPIGYTAIGCNWNGYPDDNGALLLTHWTDPEKIERLLALGEISSLREEVGEKHDFDNREAHPTWTTAYGRDRGERGVATKHYKTWRGLSRFAGDRGAYWLYLFHDDRWLFCGMPARPENLIILDADAIAAYVGSNATY